MSTLNEDTLVQQTTADFLRDELGWESVYAYNTETFGPDGTLGRANDTEVVLTRYLRQALVSLNPELPAAAYHDAIRQLTDYTFTQAPLHINQEKYDLLKDGVQVQFRDERGELIKRRLRVFDFKHPEHNHFLAARELWVRRSPYRRRADVVGFVNGLPLIFMELKTLYRDIRAAYEENLADYKDTIPHLFHHNAIIILANGVDAKIGSLSSTFEHFHEWKRLQEHDPGAVDMETLLRGVCAKRELLDLVENFILFDDSSGTLVKIVARNHQFLGVNRAVDAVRRRYVPGVQPGNPPGDQIAGLTDQGRSSALPPNTNSQNQRASARLISQTGHLMAGQTGQTGGRLGVFWHTQGSGKSYSMAFFTRKIHRTLGGNYTFLICTDRKDLDTQIYKTFAGCGLADHDKVPCRAESGTHLQTLLHRHTPYVFTLIQKFNQDVDPEQPYSDRADIIVISDEAHRTQYGRLALNLRNALPNAGFIGFTGTPLFKDDEITRRIFGEYVSTYDFQRAVDDNATVPLYYDPRGDKLGIATTDLNERLAEKLEELEIDDIDVQQRLERELKRDYHIITSTERLDQIARDFVDHYSTQWESGKAMLVCIDKITCGRMYKLIDFYWQERITRLESALPDAIDEQADIYRRRQITWMQDTRMAIVVSEEQGEVDKFRQWGVDIVPHRALMKEGFAIETPSGTQKRISIEEAFKDESHPFRIVIVCAMWLTGFDVPSLATMYLDKPLKAHTLMQAIARANRVNAGKNNGLIVDYCGILKNLRRALATFAGHQGDMLINGGQEQPELDPVKPADEDLLDDLAEAIGMARGFLEAKGFWLEAILETTGFARNRAILEAKEIINEHDRSRKKFEIMAREVFKKFKACLTLKGINDYRRAYDAVNYLYASLQHDRQGADISDIIQHLHQIVDAAIITKDVPTVKEDDSVYDISQIDFDRLRREFERSPAKHTTVQNLKAVIEKKLSRMIRQNPLRADMQKHYQDVIDAYNREKDRATIERTFEELLRFVENMSEEESRAAREGMTEETQALFDVLHKPELSKDDIRRLKNVAADLLDYLKTHSLNIDNWREKEATRDAVKVNIRDFLYNETTGLPMSYDETEIDQKADIVYAHIFDSYRNAQSSVYEEDVA